MRVPPALVGLCWLLLGLILGPSSASAAEPAAHCGSDDPPGYVFGFANLKSRLGALMGDPVSCEYADPNGSGDTLQDTSRGLAFWRKSTNMPTFTDGATHWALTADGLLTWSGASIEPPSVATAPPFWTPPPPTRVEGCASVDGLPDRACTPGGVDPDVRQDNVQQTICTPGYTALVRPPTSYTTPLKTRLMAAYGYAGQPLDAFELDHLIPLELGGAPRDPANLWPEPLVAAASAREKDAVENLLHAQVCRGALPLADAQQQIATNWSAVRR